jgi:hypothetical protein
MDKSFAHIEGGKPLNKNIRVIFVFAAPNGQIAKGIPFIYNP